MPAPATYNDSGLVIDVDPTTLWTYADTDMPTEAQTIADSIGRIHSIWDGLALGWAGTTADEAQDFSDRWNSALTQLFGSQADPDSGALPKIAQAVGMAALNYGATEDSVYHMFTEFSSGLNQTGDPQPPNRDDNDGPIDENTPPWPIP